MGGPVREHLSRSTGSENTAVVRSTDNHRLRGRERNRIAGKGKAPAKAGELEST